MISLEDIQQMILRAAPESAVEIITNPGPSGQHSLLVAPGRALEVAKFLRDDPVLKMDYCSNVTGVDWPDRNERITTTVRRVIDGEECEVERHEEKTVPGFLEAVYHLYSISLKQGPLILRMRTDDRNGRVDLPSLTPVWRSAEFQEREIFDLFGIRFSGHPDLRRLFMWDEFEGHPMRKDFAPIEDEPELLMERGEQS